MLRTLSLVTGIPDAPRADPAHAVASMNASATTKHDPIFLRIALLLVRWDDRGKKSRLGKRAAIPVPPVPVDVSCLQVPYNSLFFNNNNLSA
jgi:hypothetical protein